MSSDLFKFKFTKPTSGDIESNSSTGREFEQVMTDETFVNFRDVIYKLCGIYYTESKKYLLEGRIAKRLIACKIQTFLEYIKYIKSFSGKEELYNLFEAITINETYFYRAQFQFDALENIIIPEIIQNKAGFQRPIFRIWSAASSTGEEAYTIALMILERIGKKYPNFNFQILASDINNAVLENAKAGVYKEYAIRNVPPDVLNRYFKKGNNTYTLTDEVRRMVKFMNINLYDQATMRTIVGCDVILCCNVLIYFDIPSKQKVITHLYDSLNKGGYLFIGYSESLHGISKAFKLVHFPKAMVYKKE
ncbi:MAG: Protein-glutamate O-methyltransferase CheR [Ignavibacteria bacterium]|nr:Protein-glutamate O-methyltransferase CheR [Ignavibacteria bacterium]